jgi:hypothetical protein
LAANTNRQEDLGQVASSSSSFGAEIYLWKHFASTFTQSCRNSIKKTHFIFIFSSLLR